MNRSERINRHTDDFGNTRYHHNTRFTKDELKPLLALFFGRMNENTHTYVQHLFSYEETLIIALHHQSSGSPHNELSQMYGGECTEYAHMMNYFSNLVCHKFYHRLCGRSLEQWVSNVHAYRKAIWKDIFFDGDGNQDVDVPLNPFCPWSWLDCVQHWMFCLGVGPVNEDGDRR